MGELQESSPGEQSDHPYILPYAKNCANQPSDFTLTEPLREKCCISIFSAKHPTLEVTCLNASHFQGAKQNPGLLTPRWCSSAPGHFCTLSVGDTHQAFNTRFTGWPGSNLYKACIIHLILHLVLTLLLHIFDCRRDPGGLGAQQWIS